MTIPRSLDVALSLAAGLVVGCGSSGPERIESAADAADSPARSEQPAERFDTCRGEIAVEDARAVMTANSGAVRFCYESVLRDDPTLAGQLTLSVRVAPDGHVEAVDIGGTLENDRVSACVRDVAYAMRFREIPDGQCGVVVVPFELRPGP